MFLLQQTPVISISDTTGPLSEVYFPSVTVCNLNQVGWISYSQAGIQPVGLAWIVGWVNLLDIMDKHQAPKTSQINVEC